MMLLNDFYSIVHQAPAAGSVKAKIAINASHQILKGHFPGLPIVPGVCMMQIVLEMVQASTGKQVSLTAADSIKFLSVINPDQTREIDVSINYTEDAGQFLISANLFAGAVTFFKLKATLKIV
jgi:3-hydroxyacyl-[acyl-carrier-protein] dehydratase